MLQTPSPAAVTAQLPLSLSIAGGDVNTFRAGAGQLLREGIAELVALQTGAAAAGVLITAIQTNTSIVSSSEMRALANATSGNTTTLNATSVSAGASTPVSPSDPVLNAPLSRRRLQSNYGSCAPLDLSAATVSVQTSTVNLVLTLPPVFYTSQGAMTAEQAALLAERVRLALLAALGNATVVQRTLKLFLDVWAACTG